ncbi:MAG: tetratricopeptide repeat protein, partial [Leptolyngbyaceae cyanobacterium bins.59]|nr:tetratricopeptide repeat protein [Leptolyngbyaceae cyanobacterium bins.59]
MNAGWCINPDCSQPHQPGDAERCQWCGTPLTLNDRYRVRVPLQTRHHPFSATAVFEVLDQSVNQVKILKVLGEPSRARIARLEHEYEALTLLDAPGRIPRGDLEGFFPVATPTHPIYCLVMEKIEGQTLQQWLDAGNRLSQTLALNWLRQLLDILAIVHGRFYFHRDIKPDNLILRPDGQLALIDFGACRRISETYLVKLRMGETQHYTSPGSSYGITAVGTAGYSPPEQLHGRGVPQSDFFAVARTLVHLLSGRHPTQLPVHESGQLLWRTQAPQVAKPFADLIDELQAPAWRKRPVDTETILNRLDRLPRQIHRHQVLLSLQFRWAIGVSSVLVGLSSLWTLHAFATYQQQSQARHFAEQGAQQQLTGELDAARRNYQNALNLDPTLLVAHNNLALLCQGEGNLSCAVQHYQAVLSLDPHNWQTYYNLGNLYDEQGQFKKAAGYYW